MENEESVTFEESGELTETSEGELSAKYDGTKIYDYTIYFS